MVIWQKFKSLWKYYIFQSFLAGVVIFILVLALKDRVVMISAMGATAFIAFAMPQSPSAERLHIVGGHLVGLACGAIFTYTALPYYVEFPLAVSFAVFLMVALDVEHPPAAGTTLAVVINEVTLPSAVAIMLSAVILAQCRHYMKNILKDLV